MKKILNCILISIPFFIFNRCAKPAGGRCEQPLDVNSSEVVVVFKDKTTGRYLYSEVNPLYNKDSLKVYDQYGRSLIILKLLRSAPDNALQGIYALSFGDIYDARTDAAAFNSEFCKTYFVRYNATETDTIKACFRVLKTECGSVFNPIKVYNKGQLLDSAANTASAHITLLKN